MARPTVTTQAVSQIAPTTAKGNATLTDTGGSKCDKQGFVYGLASLADPGDVEPILSGYTQFGLLKGNFTLSVFTYGFSSLAKNTLYYVRPYVHNKEGFSYGSEVSFTTLPYIYPSSIFVPRAIHNKIGVEYRNDLLEMFFAPDLSKVSDEVVSIEFELGTSPKGVFADVKAAIVDKLSKSVKDEFYALGYKSILSTNDDIIIEDSAVQYAKKGTSLYAVRTLFALVFDVAYFMLTKAAQISGLTAKNYMQGNDYFLIEDEEDAYKKKKLSLVNLRSSIYTYLKDFFQNQGYSFFGNNSITSPVDSTTYYLGSGGYPLSTNLGYSRYRIPKAGHIKRVVIEAYNSGVVSTSETSTVNLKVNTGANIVILNNTLRNNSNGAAYSNSVLNIVVAAGDYIELNWVTPAWVTNPGTVLLKNYIYIED